MNIIYRTTNKKKAKYARLQNNRYLRRVRCRFNNFRTLEFFENFEKPHDFEKERKLRLSAKEEEVNNKQDGDETKISEVLTDLEYEKHGALHDITILESQLIKL